MIRFAAVLSILLLGACDLDLDFDFTSSHIQVTSDSGRLVITGCAQSGLLGCSDVPGSTAMSVVLDGVSQPVPAYVPKPFELFPSRGFELDTQSPADPYFQVGFSGASGVTVEELPWFDLDTPTGVHRSAGHVTLVFQGYRDAQLSVDLTSMCGTTPYFSTFTQLEGDGRVDVPLTNQAFTGSCTHEARLTQTVPGPPDDYLTVAVARTEHVTFSSD